MAKNRLENADIKNWRDSITLKKIYTACNQQKFFLGQ